MATAGNGGPIAFDVIINDARFREALRRLTQDIIDSGNVTVRETDRMDQGFNKLGNTVKNLIAGYASFSFGKSFLSSIVQVRGEFQQLEIAFETMLGDAGKADQLMGQLIDTAAKTPFDLTGVAQGAKQLMAYGTAAEDVNETLKRLGNVASGLSIPLGDLVYLYGTTQTQGRLFTQDVRQFMGRGIPLVQELAKELGKTKQEINEMVTAGEIGFPLVEKVIQNMTNQGGMFFNLMEKQSASLTGKISNLGDAWDVMLNELGESSQGALAGAIGTADSLVENYEKVGKVLVSLISTYGAYKAAVIAVSIAEKLRYQAALAQMAGMTKMQAIMDVLRAKTAALNKTMLANPYVLLATAVIGVGTALWAMRDSTSASEKAQKRLNAELEQAKDKKDALLSTTSQLINLIKDETQTVYAQTKAWKELQNIIPEVFEEMKLDDFKKLSQQEIQIQINADIDERSFAEINKKVEEQRKVVGKSYNDFQKFMGKSDVDINSGFGSKSLIADRYREDLAYLKKLESEKKKIDDTRKEAEFNAKPEAEKLAYYKQQLAVLEQQRDVIESTKLGPILDKEKLNEIDRLIGDIKAKRDAIENPSVATGDVQNKKFWEDQKKGAEEALAAMEAAQEGTKDWNAELAKINEAREKLKVWDLSDKKTVEKEDPLEIERKSIDETIKKWQLYFGYIEHGYDDFAGSLLETLSKSGNDLDSYLVDMENSLRERLFEVGLSDADKQKISDNLDIVVQAQIQIATEKNDAEKAEKKILDDFLKEYANFNNKKIEIDKKYAALQKDLEKRTDVNDKSEASRIIEEQHKAELEDLSVSVLKGEEAFKVLSKGVKKLSNDALKDLITQLNKLKLDERFKGSADAVAEIDDAIDALNENISENTAKSVQELKEGLFSVVDVINDIVAEFDLADSKAGEMAKTLSKIGQGFSQGGLVGGASAFLTSWVSKANEIFDWDGSQKREAQLRAQADAIALQNYEFERQVELINEINGISGNERLTAREKAIADLEKSQKDVLESIRNSEYGIGVKIEKGKWYNPFKNSKAKEVYSKVFADMTDEELVGADIDKFVEIYNKKVDEAADRGDLSFGPRMSKEDFLSNDEFMNRLNLLKDYAKARKELENEQFRDSFGWGEKDLIDEFINTLENAKDDVNAFGKSFEKMWDKYILNTIQRTIAEDAIKNLTKGIDEAFADGEFTKEEKDNLKRNWELDGEIAKKKKEYYQDFFGTNMYDDIADPKKTLTGQIQTVTEETASILAGQLTGMRITQADMFGVQSNILGILQASLGRLEDTTKDTQSNIVGNTIQSNMLNIQTEMNDTLRASLQYQAEIASNTRYLISIDTRLNALSNTITSDPLRAKGL